MLQFYYNYFFKSIYFKIIHILIFYSIIIIIIITYTSYRAKYLKKYKPAFIQIV